jgi:hypothetical protein
MVHFGFATEVDSIFPELIARVKDSSYVAKKVFLTGHSMGGAFAILAAAKLKSSGMRIAAVYTYGAPRVGNRKFAESYKPRHYRIEHGNDIVPHLPPPPTISELFGAGYLHTGKLKYLPKGYLDIEEVAPDSKTQHEIFRLINLCGMDGLTDDHKIESYVNYLKRLKNTLS